MAPLRQLNRARVGGHPAAAVGGTAARLPAVIPWEPLATGGVLSISSPARAGASEARKPRGCEGSAGRLADGAGSRESRGQCGRGGAREAGCSRTTPAAAAPSHVCGCCGDETSVRPKPRLQNLDARPGGGAERPGSAFRLRKAFGVPRDELADGPESQPCPCCPQASAARSAWSTCPWIVPRLRPPHPRVFSKRRGSFPSEPRARAVISLRVQFIHGLSSRGVCEPQREGTASSSRTAASSALVAAPSHRGQPKRSDSCSPHEWRGTDPEPRHQQAWAPGGGAAG